MAISKERIRRMNSSGSYDIIHNETDSDVVVVNTNTSGVSNDSLTKAIADIKTTNTTHSNDISALKNTVGTTPTVVSSNNDMTDHNKIYVLTTDGNWYYWDTSQNQFTSGGSYTGAAVATDKTLTTENRAADGKATGELILSQNTEPSSSTYPSNKIWFKEEADAEYTVPTYTELTTIANDIANEYDSTITYNIGDYCIHSLILYRCNTNNTTGTWDSSKWNTVNVSNEVNEVNKTLGNASNSLFTIPTGPTGTASTWTVPGGINSVNGQNGGTHSAGKARTGYILTEGRAPMRLVFDSAYQANVWGYASNNHTSGVRSYTGQDYTGEDVIIPLEADVKYIRVCLKRVDNANMSTDTSDPTSDASVIPETTKLLAYTDTSLTLGGKAADAKATGEAVAAVQSAVDNRALELIQLLGDVTGTPPSWKFGEGGIRARDGVNIGADINPGLCRTGYTQIGKKQRGVVLTDPDYLITVWTYADHNDNNPIASYSGGIYTDSPAIIPLKEDGSVYYRIGAKRVDGANLSTDLTDPDSDASKITAGVIVYDLNNDSENNLGDIQGINAAIGGGTVRLELERGSSNYSTGYLRPSSSTIRCRTPIDHPFLCFSGDKINCGSLYLYVRQCAPTLEGYTLVRRVNNAFETGVLTIPATGLYHIVCQNAAAQADCTDLSPDEAAAQISITHYGINTGGGSAGRALTLPKNPYLTVVWDQVDEKTSFTHGHCTSQTVFNRYKGKYDHLAISNYHASRPTYPASKYFDGADGILESPNAEHVYFPGYSSHVHLNSVGSFLASGVSNTAAGSGGYQGTVEDFMARAEALLKYPNAGGVTINHPDFSGLSPAAVIALASIGPVFATEIVNGSTSERERTENNLAIWDGVLAEGFQLFGVCTPDWGVSQRAAEGEIGYGYNHMLVYSGTEQEILLAYRNGLFYGTIFNDGLKLVYFGIENGVVTFTANQTGTIKFVTANGATTIEGTVSTAEYTIQNDDVYVRAEIQTAGNRLFTNAIML